MMKKTAVAALLLALVLCLTGCGRFVSILPGTELPSESISAAEDGEPVFQERPLLTFVGRESFGETYYTDTPTALSYQPTAADGTVGCRSYVFDRATIITACDALRAMTVTGASEEEPVSQAEYTLTLGSGELAVTFGILADGQTHVLSTAVGDYTIEGGDALWAVGFPAYSPDFDIFDLYFDSSVRAFADSFDSETPVSVGYRLNSGASITSTDPAAVEAAFRALAGAEIIVVEDQPDQNIDLTQTRDYFFTLEDGTRYTFSFAQRCLAVTANQSFGPVYYWISGTDELWAVEIASENTNGAFEGGALAGLREDIQRAADAADADDEAELTVSGIFVEYTIGEESGYIALDGDDAADFVRTVCAVGVQPDTVEAPEGDKLTVSVTLSDGSGPILYFTGDAIQQVVGINYACDGGDMSALRDQVLAYAAGGSTAQVEEGGTG